MSISVGLDVRCRATDAKDGAAVWQLIKEAGTLDLNSPYCYVMLGDLFRDTCAVARNGTEAIGFMSAFRRPDAPDTLFVWQVAVAAEARGRGVAKTLLREILTRKGNESIRYVEATIGPENAASSRLFRSLAEEYGCGCAVTEQYGVSLFPESTRHDQELLYRIGPLDSSVNVQPPLNK